MTKSKTANRILLAGLVIAGIIGVVAAVFTFTGRGKNLDADEYMQRVFTASRTALDKRGDNLSVPDSSLLKQSPYEFAVNTRLRNFSLSTLPEDFEFTAETLKLLTFTSRSRMDLQNRRLINNISAHTGGVNLFDIGLYLSDDIYAASSELLFGNNDYVYIDTNTFTEEWNASPFFGDAEFWANLPVISDLGLPIGPVPGDFSFAPYNNIIFADKTLIKPFIQDTAALYDALFDLLKTGAVSYPDDVIEEGYNYTQVTAVYDIAAANNTFDIITRSLTEALEQRFKDIIAFTADFAGAADIVNSLIGNIPVSPLTGELSVVYHIDSDDLIRKIVIQELNIANRPARMEILIDNAGNYADFTEVSVSFADGSYVRLINDTTGCSANSIEHKLIIAAQNPEGGESAFSYSALWLPDSGGDFKFSVSADTAGTKIEFYTDGRLTADDTSITVNEAEVFAAYNGEFIELRADWKVTADAEPPVFDEAGAKSVFDINAIEWIFIASRLVDFLFSF